LLNNFNNKTYSLQLYESGPDITKNEQKIMRDFYDRVLAFAEPYKKVPYLISTYSKMKLMIKYDGSSPNGVVKYTKQIVKFLECLVYNIPDEDVRSAAKELIEEAHSYNVFFKLAYKSK